MGEDTQIARIVRYIDKHGSITSMDAFGLGITRLAARISEMKKMGYVVCKTTERNGNASYARYWLEEQE